MNLVSRLWFVCDSSAESLLVHASLSWQSLLSLDCSAWAETQMFCLSSVLWRSRWVEKQDDCTHTNGCEGVIISAWFNCVNMIQIICFGLHSHQISTQLKTSGRFWTDVGIEGEPHWSCLLLRHLLMVFPLIYQPSVQPSISLPVFLPHRLSLFLWWWGYFYSVGAVSSASLFLSV